jgi:biotin synthase
MCLTIPGKVISIDDKGWAEILSHRERLCVDLGLVFDVKPGDWVLYAGERAVKVISEADASEIIRLLESNYHPVDVAKLPLQFKKIIFKVRNGNSQLTKDEILYLLKLKGKQNLETLFAEANFLRKDKIDDFICIHGIIEFSNYCQNNCAYCGLRRDNKSLERYRMSAAEVIETAVKAVKDEGYKLLVLQSGEDTSYSDDNIVEIIKKIKKRCRVFVFLSVGERSEEFYKKAFAAGATGSLFRFETSDEKLYKKIKPDSDLEKRLHSLKAQEKAGYYLATGSLIGLPDQTIEKIADDLLLLQKLNPPMISSGPYLQASGTPLGIYNFQFPISNKLELTLKYIAIARFLLPEAKIPVTTALETLDRNGRHKALLAGANSLMFNLTPEKYAKHYAIYDNKFRGREKVWQKYGLFQDEESWEMLEERMRI